MSKAHQKKTKKAQLIQLLLRRSGADIGSISTKMGWLPHTTRAALSGLRKAGYGVIKSEASNGRPTRYRILTEPEPKVVIDAEDMVNASAQ